MANRRDFLKGGILLAGGALANPLDISAKGTSENKKGSAIVISTWNHGLAANEGAWSVIENGGKAIDAVQKGVAVTEADLSNRSVGLGGNPDREGKVTLDACLMDEKSRCGAVAFLQHIDHPIDVARKVMEDTPHVMLVGQGAYEFAIANGFERSKVKIPQPGAMTAYEKWLKESKYQTIVNIENHDTIGMVAMDDNGDLSGACTTSGMAYKMHGRVGDSPIIGAGLFVDNEVGAATATGMGEAIIRIAGSHTVVELMRAGASPEEACREAVERILRKHENLENLQAGFIAIDNQGNHGGYSVYNGFNYALKTKSEKKMVDVKHKHKY
ncbi:MAG: N(4)-(beta-N-acetylglucosaminyl)-L-asparaginase [Bacteroidota bacterium]